MRQQQPMLRFLLPRVARMVVTLCGVVTVVFALSRLSGDPVALMVPPGTPPADIEVLRHQLGLDAPMLVQYGEFWSGLIHGDFGTSLVYRAPALGVVLARVPATVELALCAMGLSIVLGLMVGVLSAAQPNGLFGRAADFLAVAGRATPPFVFGILLIILLAIELRLLPSGGSGAGSTLVMPAATLAFATLPTIVRITRTGMIDALRNDYVRTARAKGLSTGAVLWRHALRNAALPIVTIIGIEFGSLLGGVAVVETLFAWPGLGYLAITALSQRDYPVIQAVLLVGAFWFVVANTVVDFAYTVLDPRTRTG